MSPYPAIRRNGACTGSLWKSHSRVRGGIVPYYSLSLNADTGHLRQDESLSSKQKSHFSLDGILAEANERQRAHEFCVLVGNTLWSYSDVWAYSKGDPPTSEIRIVGASAWNPSPVCRNPDSYIKSLPSSHSFSTNASLVSEAIPSPNLLSSKSGDFLIVTYSGTHVRCSAPTSLDKDEWLAALHAGLAGNITENRVETLTLLSKRHLQSTKVSHKLQFVHKAFNAGQKIRPSRSRILPDMTVQVAITSAMLAFEAESSFRPFVPPLPRLEPRNSTTCERKKKKPPSCSDGDVMTTCSSGGCGCSTDACFHSTGYHSPCEDTNNVALSDTHCTACGRYPPGPAMRIDAAPLPEYGMEVRVDLCHDCWISQDVLRHVRYLGWLHEVEAYGRAAIRKAWDEVKDVLHRLEWENSGLKGGGSEQCTASSNESPPSGEGRKGAIGTCEPIRYAEQRSKTNQPVVDHTLVELVHTEDFIGYRQRSSKLDSLCNALELQGLGCSIDFIESLWECAQAAESSCFSQATGKQEHSNGNDSIHPQEKISLKKEAFKVAGDMSAALKLLYEYALPPDNRSASMESHVRQSMMRDNADMLAAILEFFLDLCDEGQLDAVAFFWPQLCHIHLLMLPPRDSEEMVRVELMEDFLLTVSIRYSVHLALNLVWCHTADLEESLGSSNCNTLSRRRRSAILRFVSELESLLFEFDGGWGGGGVSLNGMLSPSQHQAASLREAMSLLQLRRRFSSHNLTRSVRRDKLTAEAVDALEFPPSVPDGTSARAQIVRNAAYFSSHITFARRLGDIAEKLRFTTLDLRSDTLQEELNEVNSSGKILGGDPLNRLCIDDQFYRTVHIPVNEGHVFRSKERTPVLLLAELVKDSPADAFAWKPHHSTYVADSKPDSIQASLIFHHQCESRDSQPHSVAVPICTPKTNKVDDSGEPGSCSGQPNFPQGASDGNAGRLSQRVLALTPRASEATDVTEEGKEMMADMIATLIVNQKKHALSPPLDKCESANLANFCGSVGTLQALTEMDSVVQVSSLSGSDRDDGRRVTALGSVFPQAGPTHPHADSSKSSGIHLTADGQFRRDVLFAIMEKGMRGSNVIAKGAATAARRAIQAMDRKRAIALLNKPTLETDSYRTEVPEHQAHGSSLGFRELHSGDITINVSIDEAEVMEALRLLIIQNQVAQENLMAENTEVISTSCSALESKVTSNVHERSGKSVDAGEVDQRLAGCGQISSSVLSALRLWKGGIVSNVELLELVQKDLQFLKQSAMFDPTKETKLIEDSAFWGRFSFGERWAEKKARLAASSPHGSLPGWNLMGCIVKSNDDLRQEAFVMQLIGLCEEAFRTAGLDLWVHPYNIVATGLSTGIIECVRNAMSFDSLKKRPGYGNDGLAGHFKRMTEIAANPLEALNEAKQNFVSSLAAYSLMSYLFMFKDRHNGNLLLDTAGHVIHIDFGFVFGIAPGGSFSLEQSTPFKLTDEMLEVMGGLGSPLFSEFVTLFCCGFLALQAHADTFLTVVEVTCRGSSFHCFNGKDPEEVVTKLRERFCPELSKPQTVAYALDLIKFATTSYGTKQYDYFQYLSQGIAT